MIFRDILEVVRRKDSEKPAAEIAIEINGYYKDICNFVEPLFASKTITTDGQKKEFVLSDFGPDVERDFMKLRNVFIGDNPVRPRENAIHRDTCYQELMNGVLVGTKNHDGEILPLPDGKELSIVYYSYPPPVTVETAELPLVWAQPMILWRVKADIHAEMREWDRAGYYNRRYERSLYEYRKMYNSSGPKKIIHPNSRI